MITPDYLNQIVHSTEVAVSELHEYLIGRIAKHIASYFGNLDEEPALMPTNLKQINKMTESGALFEEVQGLIEEKYPEIQEEIRQAFLNSAEEIANSNTEFEKEIIRAENLKIDMPDYDVNNIPAEARKLNLTDHEIRLLEVDYRRTNGTVKNITKTTANECQRAFIDACDKATFKVQHGVAPSTAIIEAIKDVAKQGVGVVYYGDYRQNIEVCIARAVRTGINQANSHIVLQRCAELGVGYVKVSEHLGARVTPHNDYTNHSWWQGKVYKVNWNDPKLAGYSHEANGHIAEIRDAIGVVDKDYPDFITTTGFGEIEGLAGINCRHSFSAFYPNIEPEPVQRIDPKENEERFKELQKQRALERDIRKTKREIAGLEDSGLLHVPDVKGQLDEAKARLNVQLNKYYTYCREHHLNADGSRMIIE